MTTKRLLDARKTHLRQGGLHKRITRKILLEPYKLKETQQFLKSRGIHLCFEKNGRFMMNLETFLNRYLNKLKSI